MANPLEGFDPTKGEDICGDGSVLKTVMTAGSGEKPTPKSKVKCHYSGYLLDGSKFDSSVDRGTPFDFTLGSGVIQGWSDGVATMQSGEKSRFVIQSHKAYGANGSPPKIPGNATLVFDIELLSWTDKEDVSEDKSGAIMKRVLVEGDGWTRPNDMATVNMRLTLTSDSGAVLMQAPASADDEPATFVIDENQLPVGVETLVKSMKAGETAEATIAGRLLTGGPLSPDATAENAKARVELVKFEKDRDSWDMTTASEKLEATDSRREAGNKYFKEGDFARALRRYTRALSFTTASTHNFTDEEKEQAKAKQVLCHINIAACHLKLKENRKAIEACKEALEKDATNVKALYRRATALTELGDWEEAVADYKKVLELDADNAGAKKGLAKVRKLEERQKAVEKKRYANMFASKPAKKEAAAEAADEPAAGK